MPISYTFDPKLNAVLAVATGAIGDEEVLPALYAMYSDPRFNPDMRHLADCTQVTENQTSKKTMMRLALISKFSTSAKRAVLIRRDAEYGLFRVFEAYVSMQTKPQLRVFRDRSEALHWLNEGMEPTQHIK